MATTLDYQKVWNEIKLNGRASITVSKVGSKKIVLRILQTKAKENVSRRNAGLMFWSKLVIVRTSLNDQMLRIDFSLLYDTKL